MNKEIDNIKTNQIFFQRWKNKLSELKNLLCGLNITSDAIKGNISEFEDRTIETINHKDKKN